VAGEQLGLPGYLWKSYKTNGNGLTGISTIPLTAQIDAGEKPFEVIKVAIAACSPE
jgi:hypothetical protein